MAPDGYFLDWAPGHTPYVAPDGMAFPIDAKNDLVLMLHMRPSGKPEVVQASIGLYFTDTPPTRVPALLRLTRQDLDIPAGEAHHVVAPSYQLPVDVDIATQPAHTTWPESKASRRFRRLGQRLLSVKDGTSAGRMSTGMCAHCAAGRTSVTMRWTYDNSSRASENQRSAGGAIRTTHPPMKWRAVVSGAASQSDRRTS